MNQSLLPRSLRALVLLLALLLVSGTALAQKPYTYSPTSHVVLRTSDGSQKTQYVSVKNETHNPLTIHFFLYGDTTIKFGYAPYHSFTIGGDSAASFPITYRAWTGDTSHAILYITDSMSFPDTIGFTGIDTGYVPPAWQLLTTNANAGTYYGMPDSVMLSVRNNTNNALTVSASLSGGSYGFAVSGSAQQTIGAGSTSVFTYRYDAGNYSVAEATVNFSGGGLYAQASIHGRNANPPQDSLTIQGNLEFGAILPGDTLCRSFSLYNRFDTAATLTQVSILQNSGYFLSDLPTLPVSIGAHDSLQITVCFVAPEEAGTNSNSYMNIYYAFGNAQRGATVYLHGASLGCFRAHTATLDFGSIPRYDSLTRTVYLVNLRNVSTEVDLSSNPDNSGFEILTSSPVTIPALDTVEVQVRFVATGSDRHQAKLVMDGRDSCGQVEVALLGSIYDSSVVVDSNSIALYGDGDHILTFEGDSSSLTARFVFFNDQTDTIKIKSITLTQGVHASIANIEPRNPEFRIGPGVGFAVDLLFDGDPGAYDDTLLIVTETGAIALTFPMHAVIHGTAGVSSPGVSVASMSITPNPSSGPIAITLQDAASATIEVLDIMGTRIASFNGNAIFERGNLAAGTYFVRASGVGSDRKPFVITTRIVLK